MLILPALVYLWANTFRNTESGYLQDQISFENKSITDFVGVDRGTGTDVAIDWFLMKTDAGTKSNQAALIEGFTAKIK